MDQKIARGDMAGLLAWVTIALAKLDEAKPLPFRYESPTTGKVQEVECAWDETCVQTMRGFPAFNKETKEPELDANGKQVWIRTVKISKRPLTLYEQASKLLGMFGLVLSAFKTGDGLQVLTRVLMVLRAGKKKPAAEAIFYDYALPVRKQIRADARKAERAERKAELLALRKNHEIRQYMQRAL